MEKIYEFYIQTTPEKLWEALTDPAQTPKYYFGNTFVTDWTVGSEYTTINPHAHGPLGRGTVIEVEAPRRLSLTMTALWDEAVTAEGASRVTYEISQVEDSCLLTITHDQLRADANEQLFGGWPMILSGLKTWLETGRTLTTPGSLMYT